MNIKKLNLLFCGFFWFVGTISLAAQAQPSGFAIEKIMEVTTTQSFDSKERALKCDWEDIGKVVRNPKCSTVLLQLRVKKGEAYETFTYNFTKRKKKDPDPYLKEAKTRYIAWLEKTFSHSQNH